MKSRGKLKEAARHFGNALELLSVSDPDYVLPGSDGMTAGRLIEIINITLQG
jgi:chemotaxis protein methyltransferase CheR